MMQEKNAEIHKTIMTTAITIHGLRQGNQDLENDSVFLEDDAAGRGPAERRTLAQIASSLKLLYIQDPTEQISDDILDTVIQNTPNWQENQDQDRP